MKNAVMSKGFISAIVIVFFLSVSVVGCGKGKKEEIPSSAATSASEDIKIPEPPGEPIIETGDGQQQAPVQQNQPDQQVPYQQPAGGNVIVNNYPSSSGLNSNVFGAIPWWALRGGNTLVPGLGNPPPGMPQVESTGGIIVYSVGFIPDGSNQYASETEIGQRGTLYGFFANQYDTAKILHGVITVNGNTERDDNVLVPAYATRGFTKPYTFPSIGSHKLQFSIDGLSDADRARNVAGNEVMVIPVPVGPGAGGGQAAVGSKDIVAVSVGFKPDGSDDWVQSARVGQQGMLQGYVRNNFPEGKNVKVALGHFDVLVRQDVVYIEPQSSYLFEKPFSFPRAESYMLIIAVNQDDAIREEGPGVADNNMASSQFVATAADDLPNLTWRPLNSFVETDDAGHQTIIRGSPAHVKIDQRFRMNSEVLNTGGAPSEACVVAAKPVNMANMEQFDNIEYPVDALQSGQGQCVSSGGWFCYTKPGDYTIKMIVNESGAVQESNRADNVQEFHFVADPLSPEEANKPNMKALFLLIWNTDERVIESTITGQPIKIYARVKNTGPVDINNAKVVIMDLTTNETLHDELVTLIPGIDKSINIDHAFTTAGPHEIAVKIDPDGDTIRNERNRDDNEAHDTVTVGLGQTQGSGPAPLRLAATPKPDAIATDIGFIPDGERDYMEEVTAGKKGTIYAVYDNTTAADIRNLKVQVRVDGQIVRDSVKTYLRKGERGTISISNYWFNTGRHKMNLILDPDSTLTEFNENNNNVGHYITAVRRQQPRNYNTPANYTGFFDPFKHVDTPGNGGSTPPPTTTPPTYKPPRTTPTFTTYGGDQGSSSSGTATTTTAKKKTPFTVKGLGQ